MKQKSKIQERLETIISNFLEQHKINKCYMFINIFEFEKLKKHIVKKFGLPDTKCNSIVIDNCYIYECKIVNKGEFIIMKHFDVDIIKFK